MLTEEQIDNIQEAAYLKLRAEGYTGSMGGFKWARTSARAIESAVRAEYADVPPEKFKRLYKVCRSAKRMTIPQTYALNTIDNGTYNPKIGGEK